MLESGSYTYFKQEALWAEGSREFRAEYLERDRSVMTKVVREVDRRHAAPAEFTLDAVAVSQGGFEGSGIRQWACGRRWFLYGIAVMSCGPEIDPSKFLAGLYSASAREYAQSTCSRPFGGSRWARSSFSKTLIASLMLASRRRS